MALGLLAPLLIVAGQAAHWFYKGSWPSERMSLLWDALRLPHPSAPWASAQAILDMFLATPLWLGVMCLLFAAGFTIWAAAGVLRSATRLSLLHHHGDDESPCKTR